MRHTLCALAIVVAVALVGCQRSGKTEAERAATKAADAWLKLLDDGKYDETWQQASSAIQQAVDQAKWRETMTATEALLGKVRSRKVQTAQYMTSVPGAPPGEYVVIDYATDCEKRPGTVIRVTPTKENGVWRVAGYVIAQ